MKITEKDAQLLRAIEAELRDPSISEARREALEDWHEGIAGCYVAENILAGDPDALRSEKQSMGNISEDQAVIVKQTGGFPAGTRFFSDAPQIALPS